MGNTVLERLDAWRLCLLNFNTSYYRLVFPFNRAYSSNQQEGWKDPDSVISSIKPNWDNILFNKLLENQPELAPVVDEFWLKLRTSDSPEWIFGDLFADKILVNSIYPLIFRVHADYSNNQDRKPLVKKLVKEEPWLMDELHKEIKKSSYIDSVLLTVYVELLPLHAKEIKDNKQSILENLNKTKGFTESNCLQVLSSALRTFKHDKELHDFLKELFAPKFETHHTLRDKFKKAEEKYFSSFKEDKPIEIFETIHEYRYVLNIKDSTVIDHFGVHKNVAVTVMSQLYESLKKYLTEKIGPDLYYSYSKKGFEINTPNFDNRPKIEAIMEQVKPCLHDILSSLDKQSKTNPDKETIPKLFETAMLHIELNEQLSNNVDYKPQKTKI